MIFEIQEGHQVSSKGFVSNCFFVFIQIYAVLLAHLKSDAALYSFFSNIQGNFEMKSSELALRVNIKHFQLGKHYLCIDVGLTIQLFDICLKDFFWSNSSLLLLGRIMIVKTRLNMKEQNQNSLVIVSTIILGQFILG